MALTALVKSVDKAAGNQLANKARFHKTLRVDACRQGTGRGNLFKDGLNSSRPGLGYPLDVFTCVDFVNLFRARRRFLLQVFLEGLQSEFLVRFEAMNSLHISFHETAN